MDLTECGRCPDCRGYTLRSIEGSTIVCSLPADEAPRGAAAGTVGAAMQRDVVCLAADLSLGGALDLLADARQRGVPVIDHADRPVGVLSAADVVAVMRARGFAVPAGIDAAATHRHLDPSWIPEQVRELPVCEVMTKGAPTARESETIDDARARLASALAWRLLVVDADGRTIGAAQV